MPPVIVSCTRGLSRLPERFTAVEGVGHVGDLVLARVGVVGAYPRIEVGTGREVRLRIGDVIVGVLGDRRSTTSIYGGVPEHGLQVRPGAEADLLAVGGVIGLAESSPASLGTPTRLELLGLARDPAEPGRELRLIPAAASRTPEVPVIFVGGTAAEVGKTTFGAALVHHLTDRHGLKVGVTKLAGTGRLRDLLTLADAGAHCAEDFVDAGMATTYGFTEGQVNTVARHLLCRLADQGAELVVAELGGDLWGAGIPGILCDPELAASARGLVLVPSDTMASLGVDRWVRENGIGIDLVHGVPHRNVMAAKERLGRGLGVAPVDPHDEQDLERMCARLLPELVPAAALR
jgi:hypothetical protein